MDDSSSSDDEDQRTLFSFHNATEAGDIETVRSLLSAEEGQAGIRLRDLDSCAPIHLAILHGRLDILHLLLEYSQSQAWLRCEGSTPLHMAACLSSIPARRNNGLEAAKLLVMSKASVFDKDDHGRLALHWAAASGHTELVSLLLGAAKAQKAAVEAAPADADPVLLGLISRPVFDWQDKQGNSLLHMSARSRDTGVLQLLLEAAPKASHSITNGRRETPLHVAAKGNYVGASRLLTGVAPQLLSAKDVRGFTPVQLALCCGHEALAKALQLQDFDAVEEVEGMQTMLLAPPECHQHITGPVPVIRGGREPPPENVDRLSVLTDPDVGILHSAEFQGLRWISSSQRATMSDVLRVHEWAYVSLLQKASAACPDTCFAALDSDTIISKGSFSGALAAAGAVISAVDVLMNKEARNAFCAVRPPGHHAGPTGIAEYEKQPHGSHGFCLLSNLAIGAAYAVNQYRKHGIRKVALLDFDVHHGNGTQACIRNTVPSLATHTFETPYSKGLQEFPVWKPWLDSNDAENIFFASVQGVGRSPSGALYPGSGATADNRAIQATENGNGPMPEKNEYGSWASGVDALDGSSSAHHIEEDPDQEFMGSSCYEPGMPRIINVGIDGPGSKVSLWRRAWRDKILPALARFEPDLIFISAGFDAHRKDHLNHRYIGLHERDYEWVTGQIIQVANRFCEGRVVSALEGGYRIQGKIVSAFSRSVAAHVRALCEPNFQVWDEKDAQAERELERQQRQAQEAAKQAALQAQAEERQRRLEQLAAEEAAVEAEADAAIVQAAAAGTAASADADMLPPPVARSAAAEDGSERKKRRRAQVDYKALDEKLKAQEAQSMQQ